ncbi:MAG: hypothetical protein QM572_03955 [Nocardioides sp.]|uniref:hypothetical protein n=1 Tax=Nocardioides sp. TaxID=35761 RepID=UPI0039E31B17
MRFGRDLRQPDGMSCGATSVVVARMLRDPAWAAEIRPSFGAVVKDVHRSFHVWPERWGTAWWSVAWHLRRIEGVPYTLRPPSYARLLAVARSGRLASLYVGTRLLPRHVTLVVGTSGAAGEELEVFDPATGLVRTITRAMWDAHELRLGGWPRAYCMVVPGRP